MIRKLAALVLLLSLSACQQMGGILDSTEKPDVRVANVTLSDLSLDAITLAMDLEVTNPYSVPLPLLGVNYDLASKGKQFLSGAGEEGGTIPAGGKGRYPVTTKIPFAGLLQVLSGVKPGTSVPYEAELGLFVDAPVIGKLEIPVSHAGELPIPAVPEVDLAEIKWDELGLTRVAATLNVDLKNTNSFPIDLTQFVYGLSLGGVKVGEAGARQATNFSPGDTQRLTLPLSFSPMDAGMGLFNMLTGSGGSYELAGSITGDTPFGAIDIPYSKKGDTVFKK